jgi:hypothetical protein
MRISGSQSRAQKITFVGRAKQGMIADLVEVTVKGCTLLVSMDGVLGGIYIDYESSFVSASKQGVGASAERLF